MFKINKILYSVSNKKYTLSYYWDYDSGEEFIDLSDQFYNNFFLVIGDQDLFSIKQEILNMKIVFA